MGFDQRMHRRIPMTGHVHFWPEGETWGAGSLGEALNLSESGLAFTCDKSVPIGARLQVEFKLPNQSGYMRLAAQVVHCVASEQVGVNFELRVHFLELHKEELLPMRRQILTTSDPKVAAITGWGRALVANLPSVVAQYREVSADQSKRWIDDHSFLPSMAVMTMPKLQQVLEESLGSKTLGNLRLKGSRLIPEKAPVWLELTLVKGRLRLLGSIIWSRQDPPEEAEAGVHASALSKEDATKLEKAA
jgi:hypothetical protein